MKDEIESYEEKEPRVEEVDAHSLRAFVGEASPTIGSTVWVGNVPTRIRSLIGARQVDVIAFDTTGIRPGDSIRVDKEPASWPAPREGSTDVSDLAFAPGRKRRATRDSGRSEQIYPTGLMRFDGRLPFVRGGVNVLLDAGAEDKIVDRLVGRLEADTVVAACRRPPAFDVTHRVTWEHDEGAALALQTAANWAYDLGDVLLYAESGPIDLDEWTRDLHATVLVRVMLDEGLEVIGETLDIGTTDSQVFLRADGTVDFSRSHSRLVSDSSWAQKVGEYAEIVEKVQIFGEDELEPDEQTLYEVVHEAERMLLDE